MTTLDVGNSKLHNTYIYVFIHIEVNGSQWTLCLFTRPTSKWHFVLRLPYGNPTNEIFKVGILVILGPHNFVCRPPIEMRLNKVLSLVKRFPTVCDTPPARKEVGSIPDF